MLRRGYRQSRGRYCRSRFRSGRFRRRCVLSGR
nr:MAG TPA: hypothetical protein [Caudoviricetes sp.]